MTRYLKALGLAMIAAFAFSALSVAGASAQEGHLTSESTRVTLLGKEDPNGTNAFTAFGSEVKCPEAVYTGHAVQNHEETTQFGHAPLHSAETEVTVNPHYNAGEGCEGGRVMDMNGCDLQVDDLTTTGEDPSTYGLKTAIVCPAGQEITMTGGLCVVHFPPQEDLTGLHATNEGGKLRLSGTVTGITARLPCLGSHAENAEWHTDILVEGIDAETEEATGIAISHA